MLKRIKNLLGIEGVKISLDLPEKISLDDGAVKGKIIFTSQTDQKVNRMKLELIEKYQRGRKDTRLINEYLLGSITLDLDLEIAAGQTRSFDFILPFNEMLSEMDQLERKHVFGSAFVKIAKKLRAVKSEYKLEATAEVEGTKLHPVIIARLDIE